MRASETESESENVPFRALCRTRLGRVAKVGWLAGWLAGSLAGWLAGWLARWLAGSLAGCLDPWRGCAQQSIRSGAPKRTLLH